MGNSILDQQNLEFAFNQHGEPVLRSKIPYNPKAALRAASEMCLQGNHSEGIKILQDLVEDEQTKKLATINLANAYLDLMQLDKALRLTERYLQMEPMDVFAHQTMFKIYIRMGNLQAAEKHLILANAIDPKNETNATLDIELLAYKNQFTEYLKRLARTKPAKLYIGNMPFSFQYAQMFPEVDFPDIFGIQDKVVREPVFMYPYDRLQRLGYEYLEYEQKTWKGEDLNNRTLLVFSEQGLGDNIWLFGLIKKIKTKYPMSKIKLVTYKQLRCVASKLEYVDELLYPCFEITDLIGVDYISNIFGLLEFVPIEWDGIYMPTFTHKKFPESKKKKCLVNWQCKKNLSNVKQINLNVLATIMINNKDNWDFYVCQRENQEEQVQEDIKRYGFPVTSMSCKEIDELFSYIQDSDLVLSVDTLHIHAAGALDKRCICLLMRNITLPFWGKDLDKVPYYNSVKAVRDINQLLQEKL